ncbi:MAG: hypothetical protein ACRCZE_03435 [Candidatus Altimarinota bacterium]
MFKKIVYTIGILMLLSGWIKPLGGYAQDGGNEDESFCNVFKDPFCRADYIKREMGDENTDWGTSFGATDPAEVGQDLYLMIYQKTEGAALDEALKATAEQFGMTEPKARAILGGDITPILEKQPGMYTDQAERMYRNIYDSYQRHKQRADLRAQVSAQVAPNEIFVNDDLDDSGFDLINDLNNIEQILFQENEEITIGGGGLGGSGDGEDEQTGSASSGSNSGDNDTSETPIDTSGGGPVTGGNAGSGNGNVDQPGNAFEADDSSALDDSFFGGINPNQCFTDNNFAEQLNEFEENSANNAEQYPNQNQQNQTNDGDGGQNTPTSGDGAVAPDSVDNWLNPQLPPNSPTSANPVPPAAPADWDKPSLCDDIICITLEIISEPVTATFKEDDNCISCHLQYINDKLQKTISHNLIPSKATGNLGESSLCKDASGTSLGSVSLNIAFTAVPIVTPPKDDLVNLGNITDEWDEFAARNGAWNYGEKNRRAQDAEQNGTELDTSPIMSRAEREYLVAVAKVADNTPQSEVIERANKEILYQTATETYEVAVAGIAKQAFGRASVYDTLLEEMESMNTYFEGFRKLMQSLNEDVPGMNSTKSCSLLMEKKECV